MWDFVKFIITILFVISFILVKVTPKDSKIYSGIKNFFKVSALLFGTLIEVCILIFIIDIIFSIFINSILEVIREFLLGFGF